MGRACQFTDVKVRCRLFGVTLIVNNSPPWWLEARHFFASHPVRWSGIAFVIAVMSAIVAKGYPVVKALYDLFKTVKEEQNLDLQKQKTSLEINRLQDEQATVKLATLDERKQYDPTLIKIIEAASDFRNRYAYGESGEMGKLYPVIIVLLLIYWIDSTVQKVKSFFHNPLRRH
jgi:hypothetical protein